MAIDLIGLQALQDEKTLGKLEIDTHTEASITQLATATEGYKEDLENEKDDLVVTANDVISEGNTQIARVESTGTAEVANVEAKGTEVKAEIDAIIQGNPDTLNALALGGKTRAEFDAEIEDNAEQIQNCYVELGTDDNPLVYIISPKDGAIGASTQMSNQLSQGNGTCFSDGEGLDCAIDKDYMYVGDGYENMANTNYTIYSPMSPYTTIEEEEDKLIVTVDNSENTDAGGYDFINFDSIYVNSSNVSSRYKIKLISGSIDNLTFKNVFKGNDGETKINTANLEENNKGLFSDIDTSSYYSLRIGCKVTNYLTKAKFEISEIQVTTTSTVVPYVPNTAPSGRLVIDEGWTSLTHSFIFYNCEVEEGTSEYVFMVYICNEESNNIYERSYITEYDNDRKYTFCISNDVGYAIDDLNVEKTCITSSKGITNGIVNVTYPVGLNGGNREIAGVFVYEGSFTKEEFESELSKIKSGKYIIPQKFIGTPHNIPYAPKKADDSGLTYEAVEVDENRDLGVLEKETRWEIFKLSDNTMSYASVTNILGVWTITGALDNVSGMLRVQYPAKIRRL